MLCYEYTVTELRAEANAHIICPAFAEFLTILTVKYLALYQGAIKQIFGLLSNYYVRNRVQAFVTLKGQKSSDHKAAEKAFVTLSGLSPGRRMIREKKV